MRRAISLALHPDLLHRERNLVRDVGGEQLRLEILEDHPDPRRDLAYARAVKRAAADSHHAREVAALELGHDPIEALGERRLARAGRAHDADHLARGNCEADAAERRTLAAVIGEAHVFERHGVRRAGGGAIEACGAGRSRSGIAVFHISPTPTTASRMNGLTTIAIALSYGGWRHRRRQKRRRPIAGRNQVAHQPRARLARHQYREPDGAHAPSALLEFGHHVGIQHPPARTRG